LYSILLRARCIPKKSQKKPRHHGKHLKKAQIGVAGACIGVNYVLLNIL